MGIAVDNCMACKRYTFTIKGWGLVCFYFQNWTWSISPNYFKHFEATEIILSVKNTSWFIVCWPGLAKSETNSLKPKWPVITTKDRCQLLFPTPKQDTVSSRCTTGCRTMCKNWNHIFIINIVGIFFLVIARFLIKIVFAIIRICLQSSECVCLSLNHFLQSFWFWNKSGEIWHVASENSRAIFTQNGGNTIVSPGFSEVGFDCRKFC